jgi:hypothetical protein
MEFTVGNFATKRIVKVEGESVTVSRKNGEVLLSLPVSEIAGVTYVAPNFVRDGTLAICESYEDSLVTTWTTLAQLPGALTITKSDVKAAEQLKAWFEENKGEKSTKSPFDMVAKTTGSFLALDGNTLIIRHTGFTNQVARGGMQGEKRIPVKSILSIQFKKATDGAAGYIQFETAGSSQKAANGGLFEAAGDENSVLFTKTEMPQFEAFREKVDSLIDASGQTVVSQASAADELAKFAKLRDEGIISAEEFDQKKKQILGL